MVEGDSDISLALLSQLLLELLRYGLAILSAQAVDDTRIPLSLCDVVRHDVNTLAILLANFVPQIRTIEGRSVSVLVSHPEASNGVVDNPIARCGSQSHQWHLRILAT